MRTFLLTLVVGMIAGAIDIAPMLKMKLDKHSIASAFTFYLIVPFIVYNTDLFGMPWWLSGGAIALLLEAPIIILIAKADTKSIVPVTAMSLVLGTLIGLAGHYILAFI